MSLNALFLNCSLKKSDETSNTEAFIAHAEKIFRELKVETDKIRLADYNIRFGTSNDEGDGDAWPQILEKIYACDILIITTPVWRGDRSSIAKMIAERMDGIWEDANDENGQYPTYNKVAGVMVDGNEDGAKRAITAALFDLNEHGFTIPVNAFSYYVGKAGPGPSYIEAEGDKHEFTNRTLLFMVHNLVGCAKMLKENPYKTDLHALSKRAEKMSE